MKVLTVPSSGKRGNVVAYIGRYGQIHRTLVPPRNTRTPARDYMRGAFGNLSQVWGRKLSQAQRDRWDLAGPEVMSQPRLGLGPLTGQQHFQGINSARACIGLPPLWEPPAPVVFGLNPVGRLVITNGENGVRLLLPVSGPVTENIMVFGQAPCSAGRNKRRNVSYLGLLPTPVAGMSDITDLYQARYGEPRPGTKVFIVTRQQKDGWEADDHETNEIVPGQPEGQQAAATTSFGSEPLMYKGCTRDAQGFTPRGVPASLERGETATSGGKAAAAAIGGGGQDKT